MFLVGFDVAQSGGLLRGFREWLIVRMGQWSPLVWEALVFQQAFPGGSLTVKRSLEPEQDKHAVDFLYAYILEFLDVRDNPERLARMYTEYYSMCPKGELE